MQHLAQHARRDASRAALPDARRTRRSKLVRCTRGAIFDVIVDLREGSPTHGEWFGVRARRGARERALRPEGVRARLPDARRRRRGLLHDADPYVPEAAAGVRWDDPAFGIEWPPAGAADDQRARPRVAGLPAGKPAAASARRGRPGGSRRSARAARRGRRASGGAGRSARRRRRSRGGRSDCAVARRRRRLAIPSDVGEPLRAGVGFRQVRVISVAVNPGATEKTPDAAGRASEAASASVRARQRRLPAA